MSKENEYWIRQVPDMEHEGFIKWQVNRDGVWTENEKAVSKFTHVIEYSAFEEARKVIEGVIHDGFAKQVTVDRCKEWLNKNANQNRDTFVSEL